MKLKGSFIPIILFLTTSVEGLTTNTVGLHHATNTNTLVPLKPYRTSKDSKTQLFSSMADKKTNNGVTSTLISNLAVVALKLRLAEHSGVSCDVNASSKSLLLKSTVGPITVRGRGWSSPLELTCRAIEAKVSECQLDMNSVIQKRKLILTTPAIGSAMVALDHKDFSNFLTHPLLEAQIPVVQSNKFEFDKEKVFVKDEEGHVEFYGKCAGHEWKFILKRTPEHKHDTIGRATIDVTHISSPKDETSSDTDIDIVSFGMELTDVVTKFFNKLVFELDGTFLSFQDMKVHRPKGKDAQILIALDIKVKKFPSPGVAF